LPERAAVDLIEWGPEPSAESQFSLLMEHELSMEKLTSLSPATPSLNDDRPINEYYLLRRDFGLRPAHEAIVSIKEPQPGFER
jgi:hypothetical protein